MTRGRRGRGAAVLVAVAWVSLLLPGCWGQRELDNISIVIGVGLDIGQGGNVSVTEQVVNPIVIRGSSGTAGTPGKGTMEHTAVGSTLEEAFGKIYDLTYRAPYFGHNGVVVFSESFARHGIQDALDYFERHQEFRKMQFLMVTQGSIDELLQSEPQGTERLTARALQSLIEHGPESARIIRSTELTAVNQLLSPSHAIVLPVIDLREQDVQVTGLALFRGARLATILPIAEARGLVWLRGEGEASELVLPCEHGGSGTGIHLLNETTSVHPRWTRIGLEYLVQVRGNAEVRRLCPKDRLSSQRLRTFREKTAQVMQSEMQRTMADLQRQRVDAAEFGSELFRSNPALWRQLAHEWDTTFESLPVRYDIRINVLRSGLISQTPAWGYTRERWPPKLQVEEEQS